MAETNHRTCTVYGLSSSLGGGIRYVGQTTATVSNRVRKHVARALRKTSKTTHREAWVRKVIADGGSIRWIVLQAGATWNKDEIWWIRRLRRSGADLVNATRGGEGMLDAPAELRGRIADRVRELWADPGYRERMKAAHAGKGWSDARRAAYRQSGEADRRAASQRKAKEKLGAERRSQIASIAGKAGAVLRAGQRAAL